MKCFTGTAVVVAPVGKITKDTVHEINQNQPGPIASECKLLTAIQCYQRSVWMDRAVIEIIKGL